LNHNQRQMRHRAKILIPIVAVAALIGLGVWALASRDGQDDSEAANPASAASDYEEALADAPPPLAALYEQGDAIIDGGLDGYEAQLTDLRGHPVVVNFWASWCGPCRFEFPFFQSLAAERGTEVAFVGVDSDDAPAAAETFLEDFPLPFPSFGDPDKQIFDELSLRGLPATAFYDSGGELAFLKQGPYESEADLAADIERYAQ